MYQMTLLEADSTGDGTPQGVVLALVGPAGDSPKDQEGIRTIRMYNLASLISLAKWAVVQQVRREMISLCFFSDTATPPLNSLVLCHYI